MSVTALPKEIDFSRKLPDLPDGVVSTLASVQSINGTSFTSGNVIEFQLPARDGLFIDPTSLFIRFQFKGTSQTAAAVIRRKTCWSVFSKLDEYIGSTPLSSVYNYHQVANMLCDVNYDVASIYGQTSAWGVTSAGALTDFDSYTFSGASATDTLSCSAPLLASALADCDHFLPTGIMGQIRLQLTVASIADVCTTGTTNLASFSINNPEICFSTFEAGVGVQNMVASMAPKLYIRTSAFANQATALASGSSGFQQLLFNHRYRSIENLYALCSGTDSAKAVNAWGDSYAMTKTGTVQAQIGTQLFPTLPIRYDVHRSTILQYNRMTVGGITDQRNSMSINSVEFGYNIAESTVTTKTEPAKHIVGFPVSKLAVQSPNKQSALLSGVDGSAAPINLLVNISDATNQNASVALVCQYSALIEVDPMTRQVNIIC
jgi:hypothetical protein